MDRNNDRITGAGEEPPRIEYSDQADQSGWVGGSESAAEDRTEVTESNYLVPKQKNSREKRGILAFTWGGDPTEDPCLPSPPAGLAHVAHEKVPEWSLNKYWYSTRESDVLRAMQNPVDEEPSPIEEP